MARPLRVLSVASEVFPLVKTGGLADVAGALPAALAAEGVAMRTLLPGYPAVMAALGEMRAVHVYDGLLGVPARLLAARAHGLELFVLDAPALYDRPGNIYVGDWPWAENGRRFAALGRTAADIGLGLLPEFVPDVVHAHDWQAALAPVYLHYAGGTRPGTVLTVHNLAFQGQFPASMLSGLGLPAGSFTADGVEYYGDIGYLKAGLMFADRITTVSPSYATEILGPDGGMGLEGVLKARAADLSGILNGLDTTAWNPATDVAIAAPFDAAHPAARAANKAALQLRLGLDAKPDALLFGVVTRLTWQKGMDLLVAALPALIAEGAQLALLGSGDPATEAGFARAAAAHPRQVGIVTGYDEGLAHLIQAGSDCILVPSRFEPCGLTQLSALRYGALPLVARVGGLADTVVDANEMALASGAGTGFVFAPVTGEMLEATLRRAQAVWRDQPAWQRLQANAMATDVGWDRSARQYAALYRSLVPGSEPPAIVAVEPVVTAPPVVEPVSIVEPEPVGVPEPTPDPPPRIPETEPSPPFRGRLEDPFRLSMIWR